MQLLWLNLASDVLPAIALGLEPPEPDVMDESPHDPRAPILSLVDFRHLLREGAVIGGGALAAFMAVGAGPNAGTVAFHGLTVTQLFHSIACRSEIHGIGAELTRAPNRLLYGALAVCLALQAGTQAMPATRRLLNLGPLAAGDVGAIAATSLAPLAVNEVITALLRDGRALHDASQA
jgi:Ca2+-transporting ATPase